MAAVLYKEIRSFWRLKLVQEISNFPFSFFGYLVTQITQKMGTNEIFKLMKLSLISFFQLFSS